MSPMKSPEDSYPGGIPQEGAHYRAELLAPEIGVVSLGDRRRLRSLRTSGEAARLAADQLLIVG